MPLFQGSGFSLELPDDCADASAYTFLLPMPDGAAMAPFITITSAGLLAADLNSHVRELHAGLQGSLDAFRVLNHKAGTHAGTEVVLTQLEWGTGAAKISETQVFYRVAGEKKDKVYCLKGTDLATNFPNSNPVFTNAFRTFMPNDIQVLAGNL